MTQEKLQKLVTFVTANRPNWKWIVEGDTIRICTYQYVIAWDIIRKIEDMHDFMVSDVIDNPTFGQTICFKPVTPSGV